MTPETAPEVPHYVRDVVDRLDVLGGHPNPSLGDVVEAFGPASFLPLLLVPALLVVSPLSGIPLFSSICGLTIALIAGQMLARRDHVWLPGFLMRRRVKGERLHWAMVRLRRLADWLDGQTRGRLGLLVSPPFVIVPELTCVLCGLAMPFLELVPFSSSLLGATVTLITVGFLSRDGLFVLAGYILLGLAAWVPVLVAGQLVE